MTNNECQMPKEKPPRSVFENYHAAPLAAPRGSPANLERGSAALPQDAAALQDSIDLAIARSFLYRFLAKAFEDPDPTEWLTLCQSESQSALWSAVCVVLRGAPPNVEYIASKLLGQFEPNGFDDFSSAYLTCFGHTVRGDCPMNEIEYGDIKADPLFQPHRLADLGAFYAAFGLEMAADAAQRHDHISIELEFMSVLAAKEAYALEYQFDDDQLALIRDAQKKFLREHLGRWTPAFTRRLARMAEGTPLAALADFTREFLALDFTRFGVTPGSEDLLLRPIDEAAERLCAQCGLQNLPPGALASSVEG